MLGESTVDISEFCDDNNPVSRITIKNKLGQVTAGVFVETKFYEKDAHWEGNLTLE